MSRAADSLARLREKLEALRVVLDIADRGFPSKGSILLTDAMMHLNNAECAVQDVSVETGKVVLP